MKTTVAQYLLDELKLLGINNIFGVPGDYAFPLDDAIEADPDINWVGCCNELNASYAADGFARIHGISALCTTFGVGELCTLGGIAGAYAEHVPIVHIVGMPPSSAIHNHRIQHHTLGTGQYKIYAEMNKQITAAWTVITPENVVPELRRVLQQVVYDKRPVYIAIPMDYANVEMYAKPGLDILPGSDADTLASALQAAAEMINAAKKPVLLPGYLLQRLKLTKIVNELVDYTQIPFSTMFMDKSTLNEQSPLYLGMYDGKILTGPCRDYVESADCIINLGAVMSDFNTGSFSADILPGKSIVAELHRVIIGGMIYHNVEMADFVTGLKKLLTPHAKPNVSFDYINPVSTDSKPGYYANEFFVALAKFLKKDDIVITETGCSSMGLGLERMPEGCNFINQTLWGAIGWATPSAFGAAMGDKKRRVILLTGEGSHQLTVQEISQFTRHNLTPIIFVVNNSGYLIERVLSDNPRHAYNDLPQWSYADLPKALGMNNFISAKVNNMKEVEEVFAEINASSKGAYVEVLTPWDDVSLIAKRLGENRSSMYN